MTSIAGNIRTENQRVQGGNSLRYERISASFSGQEPLEQRVGTCWRCKTPIEIMSERQWFVKIVPEEIMNAARQVKWTPGICFFGWRTGSGRWNGTGVSRGREFLQRDTRIWFCAGVDMILPERRNLPLESNNQPDRISHPAKIADLLKYRRGGCPCLPGWILYLGADVTGWDGGHVS